jgi:acyl carrier protein
VTDSRTGWDWDSFEPILNASVSAVLGEHIDGLNRSSHLLDDVGLDSFGVLVVLDVLEERLGVQFPAFDHEPTAGRLFELVLGTRGGAVAPGTGD